MSKNQDVLLEKKHRCGLATLNRPKALNAINYDMIAKLSAQYIEWAGDPDVYGVVLRSSGGRAFCSGGDLKALYQNWKSGKLDDILEVYTSEYQHNWTLDRFIKPHVSLMDGYVFGGGVGISLYGTHKVAGENYRFAMPEAGIGFFPDIGATHFLTHMPGQIGLYLALTGNHIDRADAYALGLLTHCINSSGFDAITAAMCVADPIDPVLDSRHEDPGPSKVLELQNQIDMHFSMDSVEEILASLENEKGTPSKWASETAESIRKCSPLSLKVSFRQMRNSGQPTLEEALELDGRIAHRFLSGDELYEGIRALLIDKDGKPSWSPSALEDVSDEMVQGYFEPSGKDGFKLVNPFL
jgi:enoyl-CoA hydratase